jgi:predicted LPLAT superfamily acyltransferase
MKKSSHWSELSEWSLICGMRFLLRVYLIFGRGVLQFFLYPIVSGYWLANHYARQSSRDFLNRVVTVHPESKRYNSYQHFISFANAIIDKLAAWSGSVSLEEVIFQGRDDLLAELNKGRGAVLLGSHLGNLEVCRVIADLDNSVRINVLVHTKHAEKFNQLLTQTNKNSGLNLIQVTEINVTTAMFLSNKIEAGELVIITADRTPVNSNPRVSRVKFLGEEAAFPQGAFILAALLRCPVYTLFCLKQNNKYVIFFEHFSDKLRFPRKDREQAVQQTVQRYAQCLEQHCLNTPLQWFNFFDFWAAK